MAWALDKSLGSVASNTETPTLSFKTTEPAAEGAYIFVAVSFSGSTGLKDLIDVGGGGLAWTNASVVNVSNSKTSLFWAYAPAGLPKETELTATFRTILGVKAKLMAAVSFAGGPPSISVTSSKTASGVSTAPHSLTVTANEGDLIIAVSGAEAATTNTPEGGTTEDIDTNNSGEAGTRSLVIEHKVAPATGNVKVGGEWGAANNWETAAAAFSIAPQTTPIATPPPWAAGGQLWIKRFWISPIPPEGIPTPVEIAATVAISTAIAPAPTPTVDVLGAAAQSTASVPAPAPAVEPQPPAALSKAQAPSPVPAVESQAPVAQSSANIPPPIPKVAPSALAAQSSASSSAPAPAVEILGSAAVSTTSASAPSIQTGLTILVPPAIAVASGLAPVPAVELQAPASSSAASAPAPSARIAPAAPAAQATVSAPIPIPAIEPQGIAARSTTSSSTSVPGVRVNAPAAVANAVAPAPTINTGAGGIMINASPAVGIATSTAPTISILVTATPARASISVAAPTLRLGVLAAAALAIARAPSPELKEEEATLTITDSAISAALSDRAITEAVLSDSAIGVHLSDRPRYALAIGDEET